MSGTAVLSDNDTINPKFENCACHSSNYALVIGRKALRFSDLLITFLLNNDLIWPNHYLSNRNTILV